MIPKMKIHAYAKSRKWTTPNRRKQKKRSRCRYELEHSGSLVHGDWHQTSQAHPFVVAWLDDASGFVLFAEENPAISAERSIASFDGARAAAARRGVVIREANTDRGSEFYASEKIDGRKGTSRFEDHLARPGIKHVLSRVNNLQTNGKLERWWLEYDRHRWRFHDLQDFLHWYNEQIHGALWEDLYENPREAFQRKQPPEALLGGFFRELEQRPELTPEALYAT